LRVGAKDSASRREIILGAGLGLGVAVLFAASLASGQASLDWPAALAGRDDTALTILTEIRLPRALLAVLVGASLGLAGAALQGLLLNPLAEPALIGVSASAALGAVIVFYFGLSSMAAIALPLGGMAGAGVAAAMMFAMAGRAGGSFSLILAGIAVNSIAAALTALALNLAPSPYAASEIMFWILGSLADRSQSDVALALPFVILGWIILLGAGSGLSALTLGEDTARTLGVNVARLKAAVVLGVTLCVGASTAIAGSIGFVGLVVPHLIRPLIGFRPGPLLYLSAMGGAALLLAADIAAREIGGTPELRIGVLTALVGAPFFLWLVIENRLRGS
jgi:iron complex transport system permease protein